LYGDTIYVTMGPTLAHGEAIHGGSIAAFAPCAITHMRQKIDGQCIENEASESFHPRIGGVFLHPVFASKW
jgi:hypothetical protein